jgi:MFS family permease
VLHIVGEVGGTIWVLYGEDKFAWDPWTIGFSLAGFGLFHALAQAFVAGPIAERFGERRALLIGIVADAFAYVAIALATKGWMAFLLLPMFCLGGIGQPAIQSLLSRQVGEDQQGRLQGVLASVASLASVIGPVVISQIYFASRGWFPGLVWTVGAALGLMCLPILLIGRQRETCTTGLTGLRVAPTRRTAMKVERLPKVRTSLSPTNHPYMTGAWTPLHEEVDAWDLRCSKAPSRPTWTASICATPRTRSTIRSAATTRSTATAWSMRSSSRAGQGDLPQPLHPYTVFRGRAGSR